MTYCDEEQAEWHMLMPSEMRNALSKVYEFYLDLALQGKKGPSAKELRMMDLMSRLCGE